MVFIATSGGIIEASVPSPVAQGSYLSNEIVLLAPFPESAMVTCAFVLPNGIRTAEALTDNTEYAMASIQIPSITETATGKQYAAWRYTLNGALTEFAGDVTVQFFVYHSTSRLATYAATFYVASGVDVILPDPPDSNIYREILEAITALNLNNSVIVDQMQAEIERIEHEKVNRVIPVDQTVVYAADPTGDITIPLSFDPDAYKVAGYSNGGVLKTNTPTAALDATNKQYVDSAVGAVESVASDLSEQVSNNTQRITDSSERIDKNSERIDKNSERIDKNSKRITNLEKGITPDPFYTDDGIALVKNVPANALPYAMVSMVGGMTRKSTNLWTLGDITVNASPLIRNISLPAGTYTISLLATSTDTDSDICRILLKDVNGGSYYWGCERGVRASKTVTLNAALSRIEFDASSSSTASARDTATFTDIMLNKGSTALPYEPYFEGLRSAPVTAIESVGANLTSTLPIPEAVQSLDGYGEGNPDNTTEYNSIEWDENGVYCRKRGKNTNGAWVPLESPETTDISDIITLDNLFAVEGGGTVTMVNEHGYAVPSTITYQLKQEEATA